MKKLFYGWSMVALSALLLMASSGCRLSVYPPDGPVFTTGDTSQVSTATATVTGMLTQLNGHTLSACGHCWSSTNQVPDWTINDGKTVLAGLTAPGPFVSGLKGLKANVFYFVRSYVITEKDTLYGDIITFKTAGLPSAPTVTTGIISGIGLTGATDAGTISAIGSSPVTQYGHCWSNLHTSPLLTDNVSAFGAAAGPLSYSTAMTGLQPGITYYVRAYATNAAGTSFGNTTTFTTTAYTLATVTTGTYTYPTTTSVSIAGSVTATGNTPVTQYGHCYSTVNTTPTVADATTKMGAAAGPVNFTSNLTGLSLGENYYIRAYATNAAGTSYGTVQSVFVGKP